MRARSKDTSTKYLPGVVQFFNAMKEGRELSCFSCGMKFSLGAPPGIFTTIGFQCLGCFAALVNDRIGRGGRADFAVRIEMMGRDEDAVPWDPNHDAPPQELEDAWMADKIAAELSIAVHGERRGAQKGKARAKKKQS